MGWLWARFRAITCRPPLILIQSPKIAFFVGALPRRLQFNSLSFRSFFGCSFRASLLDLALPFISNVLFRCFQVLRRRGRLLFEMP
jgi:hypothetical protein